MSESKVEIRAWLHPHIVSFKGVVRTSCPPEHQDDIEGTVAYGAEVWGGDGYSVTDKFGVKHDEIPLVPHADYKSLEDDLAALRGKVAPLLFAAAQAYGCTENMADDERDRVLGKYVRGPLEAFL